MSQISKAIDAPVAFLSLPRVTQDADNAAQIVASSMQALVHRIYQMDPTAYWQGSLGADDTKTEYITMGLYAGSAQAAFDLDAFLLLNHNLNNFVLEYCTDYTPGAGGAAGTGTWQNLATVTGQAGADYQLFLASPKTAVNGLRITMTTTLPANQQKKLGNFIAALGNFQFSKPFSKYNAVPAQVVASVPLADGTRDNTYFFWSDNSCVLNVLAFEHQNMTAADKASLDALFATAQAFLCYPEPYDNPRNIYLCMFEPGAYNPVYYGQYKGAGYNLPFKLRQVGYV
jgi:hypothetical protein